jgi:predicted nucleic acid-binding protein
MITAIDTNIILDILIPNAQHASGSKQLLDQALAEGALVINEVVYAELASQFTPKGLLEKFLTDTQIRLEHSSNEALQYAGEIWQEYVQARGAQFQCPYCGTKQMIQCLPCKKTIIVRQHILSDFLVGAFAGKQADRLLTRDLGYYKNCF